MSFVQLVILAGVVFLLLTWGALIDIARKDFGSIQKKALWGIIAFVPFIGCVVYFLFGYRRGVKKGNATPAQNSV